MPDSPNSLLEAFLRNTDQTPDKPCIHFEGATITYSDLRAQAFAFAGNLASLKPASAVHTIRLRYADFVVAFD